MGRKAQEVSAPLMNGGPIVNLEMIRSHPLAPSVEATVLAHAMEAVRECTQACATCADACLAEDMVAELRDCIGLNLACADVCAATAGVLARQVGQDPGVVTAQLQACVAACRACAAECEQHAGMHEHCRVCADSCRRCERACGELLAALA